jgi:hypothetical protein
MQKVKLSLYRPWTSLRGYRSLRSPAFIATQYIKVGNGYKRVNFSLNVCVLLVTGLYIQSTIVVQTSQPLSIHWNTDWVTGLVYISYSFTSMKCIYEDGVQFKTAVFWDVVSCSPLELYKHSEASSTSNINFEDWGSSFLQNVHTLLSNCMALYHSIVCIHCFQNLRPWC